MAYINHRRFVSTNTHPYAGQVSTSQGRHVSNRRGTEFDCKRKEATVKLIYQAGTSAIFLPACTRNYRIKISPVPAYTLFFFSGMGAGPAGGEIAGVIVNASVGGAGRACRAGKVGSAGGTVRAG